GATVGSAASVLDEVAGRGAAGGLSARSSRARASFQSAIQSCDPPPDRPRVVDHTSLVPSGENTGSTSADELKVTRTGSRSPSTSTMYSSKLSNPSLLDVKMM